MSIDTTQTQFKLKRRGFLQLAAGSAAQTVVPVAIPFSKASAIPSVATAAHVLAAIVLSETQATKIAASFLGSVQKHDREYFRGHPMHVQACTDYTHHAQLIGRFGNLFGLFSSYGQQQLAAAQNSESWKERVTDLVARRENWNKQGVVFSDDPDMRHFPNGVVTHQGIMKELFDTIDQILDINEKERSKPRVVNQHEWPYFGNYVPHFLDQVLYKQCINSFPDMQANTIDRLTAREKIEMIMERVFSGHAMSYVPLSLQHNWFPVPKILQPLKANLEEQMRRWVEYDANLYGETSRSTLDNIQWVKINDIDDSYDFARHLKKDHPEHFSVEEYYQRRDVLNAEMDIFFTKRSIRKRFGIEQARTHHPAMKAPWQNDIDSSILGSRGETSNLPAIDDGHFSLPPAPLLRGVAVVRGTFSKTRDLFSGLLRTIFTEKVIPATDAPVEPEKSLPQALEYSPSDTVTQIDLQVLNNEENLVPVSRTSLQP